jgi:apolipoprotein N-acyltransferase
VILNFLLAFLSGGLLAAVFPPHNLAWLAPVALAPLLFAAAREDRWQWRFLMGYVAGIHYWFGLCSWIATTLAQFGGVGNAVAWLLFGLFCLAKAIQLGVFAALAGPVMKTPFALPGVAALWVALEWTHSYTGFEWLNLGNAGSGMSVPLRLAPFTGVWGLSFVFMLMAAAVANLVVRGPRARIMWLLPLIGLIFLPDVPPVTRGGATAIVTQPNLADDIPWTDDLIKRTVRQLSMLSLSPVLSRDSAPDVILWPEMPAPFYDYDSAFTSAVESVAKTAHAGVITGAVARAGDGAPLNSAILIGPDGRQISRYDKVNLVPFGEFVPWPFGLLTRKVSTEAGDFEAGRNAVVSQLGDHKIGIFICYESVFPSYVRRFVASGAEALFNISNDSWFGNTAARYQHLLIVRMRAAENQRWIVRATNDGISGAIDPAGRVLRSVAEHQELAARLPYNYRNNLTLYTRFGDWFVALCAILAAACLMNAGLPKHHRP